jgi:hypothetical protein
MEARCLGSEPLGALGVILALWLLIHSGALLYCTFGTPAVQLYYISIRIVLDLATVVLST